MTTVTITKLDHTRAPKASYPGAVVFRAETVIVARCTWTRPGMLDVGPFCLEQGDIFVEYYYPGEWFNIFQVHSAAGVLKGWYCNLTAPAEIADGIIRWHDLALDLVILPDGRQYVMDEDEFEALNPSAELRARVEAALQALRRWTEEGRWPFGWGA